MREKKVLYPTELGNIITDLMKDYFMDIVDIDFTANMENKLDAVEEGKYNWKKLFMNFTARSNLI